MLILDRRESPVLEDAIHKLGFETTRVTREDANGDVVTGDVELEYADCCFSGNGPDGECVVGFERKKLGDLITSMKDRRLSGHQLRGCRLAYDFVYLVAEGIYREGSGGEIEEPGRWNPATKKREWRPFYSQRGGPGGSTAISYEQLDHFLCTLELKGGVIVKRTKDEAETARFYVSRWRWFNQKRWKDHTSHDQLYTNTPAKGHGTGWGTPHEHDEAFGRYGRGRAVVVQEPPTTLWRMAAQLPGLDRRAEVVARHFGTVRDMAVATEKEWTAIDFGTDAQTGRRNPGIGPVTAKAVVRAITVEGA